MGVVERHTEDLARVLRHRLVDERRAEAAQGADSPPLEAAIRDLVGRDAAVLSAARRERLTELVLRDTVGLGPLEPLLDDPAVEEVMVNGHEAVYVERGGRIEATDVRFESDAALRDAIERILSAAGRRVDELNPMVDARLGDGSRVNVVIPPLAVDGPMLSIRRFGATRPGPEELVASGTLTEELRETLAEAVAERRSLLVSGGTGSGKTTLLNALSTYIAADERVVTIEDAPSCASASLTSSAWRAAPPRWRAAAR